MSGSYLERNHVDVFGEHTIIVFLVLQQTRHTADVLVIIYVTNDRPTTIDRFTVVQLHSSLDEYRQ